MTSYLVKGGSRERFKTDNLAKIPGVEVSTRETRDLVKGKSKKAPSGGTKELPWVNPASAPTQPSGHVTPPARGPESQRPTMGLGTRAPASDPPGYDRSAQVEAETAPFGAAADEGLLQDEGATFQPPWVSRHPTPPPSRRPTPMATPAVATPGTASSTPTQDIPISQRSGLAQPAAPQQRRPSPSLTTRQAFAMVSYEAGTEPVSLPGIKTPAQLPVVRVEGIFNSYDEAFATAARYNRQRGGAGRVYTVSPVQMPL